MIVMMPRPKSRPKCPSCYGDKQTDGIECQYCYGTGYDNYYTGQEENHNDNDSDLEV